MPKHSGIQRSPADAAFQAGLHLVQQYALFQPLLYRAHLWRRPNDVVVPKGEWAVVTSEGVIHVHPNRLGTPNEWAYVIAHCLLHLGLGHVREMARPKEWNAACDVVVGDFLSAIGIGTAPVEYRDIVPIAGSEETKIYEELCRGSLPAGYFADIVFERERQGRGKPWEHALASGVKQAVTDAVRVASGEPANTERKAKSGPAQARTWFLTHYPLLASLAASFKLIEDRDLCHRMDIAVAAVNPLLKEIYFNPAAALTEEECKFVMAHEMLHVGLRHQQRAQGRDHFLWNVACDFVINQWLLDMRIGSAPTFGLLHDVQFKDWSAEEVYDHIVCHLTKFKRIRTFRGQGSGDVLGDASGEWWRTGPGLDLDAFFRRALGQGLEYHEATGRGFLPAGLVEDIYAQSQPPIPWDVELAEWFDDHFAPIEMRRSYQRLSRRQMATPDIPRPRTVPVETWADGRTYGVIIDTSGSMDRVILAQALGAIASYSVSRDVPAARVIFCDAEAYDAGYLSPEEIAGKVQVRGRGGTVLQPGVNLLEGSEDFPDTGPILIITDGYCEDDLVVKHEHAYLVPENRQLPFHPRGPVFRMPPMNWSA